MNSIDAAEGTSSQRTVPHFARSELQPQRVRQQDMDGTATGVDDRIADGSAQTIPRNLTVLIAASGVMKSHSAREVASAITEGLHAALPSARVLQVPGAEGGAAFTEAMVSLSGGTLECVSLLGAHGEIATGLLGLIGPPSERTAVISVEGVDQLRQRRPELRHPTCASSRDTGQMIIAALDRRVQRIIINCGDAGANDGGIGMAAMLGVRFYDARRTEITEAGGLLRLAMIDMSHRDPRLDAVRIEVVANPANDLLGERGVTRVHGPGQGATPLQVLRLEQGLTRYAEVVLHSLGVETTTLPGGGAAGGLAAGLVAFAGAALVSHVEFLDHCPGLQSSLAAADMVITTAAEDIVDGSTPSVEEAALSGQDSDPAPAWIARRARARGVPVIAFTAKALLDAVRAPGAGPSAFRGLLGGWNGAF
jgi:glycerate kinase